MSMSVSDDTCTCGMDERDERRLKHFHRAFSTGQHIWWWPKLCYIGRGSNIFCDYCFHSAYREVHNRDLDHIVHRSFFSFLSLFKKSPPVLLNTKGRECIGFGFPRREAGQIFSCCYRILNVTWQRNVRKEFASIFCKHHALGLCCYAVTQQVATR